MQLTRVAGATAMVALLVVPAEAGLDLEEQEGAYLFRYFADSDHVHVWSHFGQYGLELEGGPMLDVQWNHERLVVPAIDAPIGSEEAVDAITTASRPIANGDEAYDDYVKTRDEVQGSLGYRNLSLGYYVSSESDYFAQQLKASIDRDFLGQNLNLSAGSSYGWDVIEPLADADATGDTEDKTTWHGNVVATGIVTPTTVLRAGVEVTVVDGLQHSPYRAVYAGGGTALEAHPDHRERRDLFVKLSQYFLNRSSVRLDYRYYTDDWGITSQTMGVRLHQIITDDVRIRYRYRHYDQNDADFYRDEYETSDGVEGFLTGDYRLAAMTSHLFGTRLDLNLGVLSGRPGVLDLFDVSLTYERYFNSNNFSANVFETGLGVRF